MNSKLLKYFDVNILCQSIKVSNKRIFCDIWIWTKALVRQFLPMESNFAKSDQIPHRCNQLLILGTMFQIVILINLIHQ